MTEPAEEVAVEVGTLPPHDELEPDAEAEQPPADEINDDPDGAGRFVTVAEDRRLL